MNEHNPPKAGTNVDALWYNPTDVEIMYHQISKLFYVPIMDEPDVENDSTEDAAVDIVRGHVGKPYTT